MYALLFFFLKSFQPIKIYYQTSVFLKPPNKVRTDLYENNRCLKDTLLYVAKQNKRKKGV